MVKPSGSKTFLAKGIEIFMSGKLSFFYEFLIILDKQMKLCCINFSKDFQFAYQLVIVDVENQLH